MKKPNLFQLLEHAGQKLGKRFEVSVRSECGKATLGFPNGHRIELSGSLIGAVKCYDAQGRRWGPKANADAQEAIDLLIEIHNAA